MAKPSWLSVTPTSGSGNGTISNSSSAHTGRVKREGVVTVQGSGVATAATYKVIQTPKAEYVSFDNGSEMAVEKSGGNVTITGKSNSSKLSFSWVGTSDVTLPSKYEAAGEQTANSTAITGDPGATAEYEYNVTLSVPENTSIGSITRVLKVTANGGQYAQISLVQSAGDAFLSVAPTEITIPQDGSAVSVTVTSNTSWTVS